MYVFYVWYIDYRTRITYNSPHTHQISHGSKTVGSRRDAMDYARHWNRRTARENEAPLDRIARLSQQMADANAAIMARNGSEAAYRAFQEAELAFARAVMDHYQDLPLSSVVADLECELGLDAETVDAREQAAWDAQRAEDMLSYRSAVGRA